MLLAVVQVVLRKLSGADPEGRRHCIKLLRTFEYRGHLCLVFEAMVRPPSVACVCAVKQAHRQGTKQTMSRLANVLYPECTEHCLLQPALNACMLCAGFGVTCAML